MILSFSTERTQMEEVPLQTSIFLSRDSVLQQTAGTLIRSDDNNANDLI
jgi:hypothetical protein